MNSSYTHSSRKTRSTKQEGFSLIELLIVLGLITTAAVLALSTVDNQDNQNRFDETRSKLNVIQNAILGNANTASGTNLIDGFVADMGRLPLNLVELIIEPLDCDPDTSGEQRCLWSYDNNQEIWHGWHGPYIRTINSSFLDGWGKNWNWDLSVANQLTISSFGLDNDQDVSTNNLEGRDRDYGNSALQTVVISENQHLVTLPHSPLHLDVDSAPVCGQCRADGFRTEANCVSAGFHWDSDQNYCVNDSGSINSPNDCDAVASSTWVPVYGNCSEPGINSEGQCSSVGGEWTPINSCVTPQFEFNGGETDICARVVRINHGNIVTHTHRSSDSTILDLSINTPSTSGDESFEYKPVIVTDSLTPQPNLSLPQGAMRIGLYVYDDNTNSCTDEPFPSNTAQGYSDVIFISTHHAPNIGTSSNPIKIRWKSR